MQNAFKSLCGLRLEFKELDIFCLFLEILNIYLHLDKDF